MTTTKINPRLNAILECLANPDRDNWRQVWDDLPYWQSVRMRELEDAWCGMDVTKDFEESLSRFKKRFGMSSEEDADLNFANVDLWSKNAEVFYRAGFEFGQQLADINPATHGMITQALAFLEDNTEHDDWAVVLHIAETQDVWEKAAVRMVIMRYNALFPKSTMYGKDEWDLLLEELGKRHSIDLSVIDQLDISLVTCTGILREYMFHEGRLDSEALNGGGAR